MDGGALRETSYKATVSESANLMTSFKKTAVDVRYRFPPTAGTTLE